MVAWQKGVKQNHRKAWQQQVKQNQGTILAEGSAVYWSEKTSCLSRGLAHHLKPEHSLLSSIAEEAACAPVLHFQLMHSSHSRTRGAKGFLLSAGGYLLSWRDVAGDEMTFCRGLEMIKPQVSDSFCCGSALAALCEETN